MTVAPLAGGSPPMASVPPTGAPPGTRAFMCGLEGLVLTAFETAYLAQTKPWGVILFGRNIDNPGQVRSLTGAVRKALGWHAPILIDQEGGRVQRMKPPHWQRYPAASRYGAMESQQPGAGVEAAHIATLLMADDLLDVGINVNCAPVLDLRVRGGTNAIGDRAYHGDPQTLSKVARAVHDAYLQAGVAPVIKHIPGHGRAVEDSHYALPTITTARATLEATDFVPFKALNDAPFAMTAHLIFQAIDPDHPVTLSPIMIKLIREHIGFEGALMSDDLGMGALTGPMNERAALAIAAGCDLALHCNGVQSEMEAIWQSVPLLEGVAAKRCASGLARLGHQSLDRQALLSRYERLLASHPHSNAALGDGMSGDDPTHFARPA